MAQTGAIGSFLIPPETPVGTGSAADWDALEIRLGLRLPADYKDFVAVYGAGMIELQELSIVTPFAGVRSQRLERMIAAQRKAHSVLTGILGANITQPAGLIPWATNPIRGMCYWEANAPDPDRWTVYSEIDDEGMSYPESMTSYLVNAFRGAHTFVYAVEPSDITVPTRFTAAKAVPEVAVPLAAVQRPGRIESPELSRLGLWLEVVAPQRVGGADEVHLAVRTPAGVAVELIDDAGHWVGVDGAGFGSDPGRSWGVYWRRDRDVERASALVLEVLG